MPQTSPHYARFLELAAGLEYLLNDLCEGGDDNKSIAITNGHDSAMIDIMYVLFYPRETSGSLPLPHVYNEIDGMVRYE